MSHLDLQRQRNNVARLINFQDRRHADVVRFNKGSTSEHELAKARECWRLTQEGKSYICEARFENGSGRADIVVLDTAEVIEIVHSEKEDSLEEKRRKYPLKNITVVLA